MPDSLGIKTFLVDDCLLNTKNLPIQSDYRGSFADLAAYLDRSLRNSGLSEIQQIYDYSVTVHLTDA